MLAIMWSDDAAARSSSAAKIMKQSGLNTLIAAGVAAVVTGGLVAILVFATDFIVTAAPVAATGTAKALHAKTARSAAVPSISAAASVSRPA